MQVTTHALMMLSSWHFFQSTGDPPFFGKSAGELNLWSTNSWLNSSTGFLKVSLQTLISSPYLLASLSAEITSVTGCLLLTARNFHTVANIWHLYVIFSAISATNRITLLIWKISNHVSIQPVCLPYTHWTSPSCATDLSLKNLEIFIMWSVFTHWWPSSLPPSWIHHQTQNAGTAMETTSNLPGAWQNLHGYGSRFFHTPMFHPHSPSPLTNLENSELSHSQQLCILVVLILPSIGKTTWVCGGSMTAANTMVPL